MIRTAYIAVEAATYAIDKPFSYFFDDSINLSAGCRVLVPFGKGNRLSEGFVLKTDKLCDFKNLKEIILKLDEEPILTENQIKLAFWMRQRYFCTFYDALKTILPSEVSYQFKKSWKIVKNKNEDCLTDEENRLYTFLSKKSQDYSCIVKQFGKKTNQLIQCLETLGLITPVITTSKTVNDKSIEFAELIVGTDEVNSYLLKNSKNHKMCSILSFLLESGRSTVTDITYFTGASLQSLKRLQKLGYISISEEEVYRIQNYHPVTDISSITLNSEQQACFNEIIEDFHSNIPGVNLIHGVTGSGKTQVYIKLAEQLLMEGKSSIILVPEIALTPQMMDLFTSYFGNEVALLHSGLRLSERYDQWKRIKKSEAHIVLGTRSAIFAPVDNLGFICIDEEQEPSYESESSPCYHVRDVAKYICTLTNARLVLGSATPTVSTYYYALNGRYRLHNLKKRYNHKSLPPVTICDMRTELRNGNTGILSNFLIDEIRKNLESDEQCILFINRRGNSHQVICSNCGYIPMCINCSVSLTYHSKNNRLMCHYCGYNTEYSDSCPICDSKYIHLGFGTQKIEEELHTIFPNTAIIRMDADTVSKGHESILKKFEDEHIPILLGTQMVAKGLNFKDVTLVGVLSADTSLYLDHYSASERTFNLITQVIGRAGRNEKQGRAVIQTYTPENPVIKNAAIQDYLSFYQQEIEVRKIINAPPFKDQYVLTLIGLEDSVTYKQATLLKKSLSNCLTGADINILGPTQAPIFKQNNKYRYRITIIGKDNKELRERIASYIRNFSKIKENKNISIFADCNRMG